MQHNGSRFAGRVTLERQLGIDDLVKSFISPSENISNDGIGRRSIEGWTRDT
jgi:hypothetical protein